MIGEETVAHYVQHGSRESLRACFKRLMTADHALVESAIRKLCDRWLSPPHSHASIPADPLESELRHVFSLVHPFYPRDVGCLSLFLLNYVKLAPGQAIFLKANEPHSYLSGDCVECMSQSDNVIRAGFTPKFKDVDQLVRSLSYECLPVSSLVQKPRPLPDGITCAYTCPVKDFAVDRIHFDCDGALCRRFVLPARESASLMIVIRGHFTVPGLGVKAESGSVFLIPAMLAVTLVSCETELLCFRAFAHL